MILYLISLAIIVIAVVNIFKDVSSGAFTVYKLLDEVGLLVFSIAVIDVAKYLMTEEVLRETEERNPVQARKALAKFAVIIATALSLEGLVLTIEMAKVDVTKILYPMSLLVTAILFIVGMGIYQKITADSAFEPDGD
ncbi:MAG: hypothetical protein SP1CHLAM54_07490 [Chlamydiia bacterium]|nr:hypothetical protein [Chlamydiia bacterium]MCH9615655.1 hypothetical protein [Chlamydiia bacterium]MCH9628942.1 hypothetical protein [Chlamydiia bacterium]